MNFFGLNLSSLIISLPAVLLAIGIHEAAHGFVAYALGDPTAKEQGRLTLNPIAHIDFLGMLCLLFFSFGWAKPVPVNSRYFKNPKSDIALVSLAGPLANIVLAFIMLVLTRIALFTDFKILIAFAQFFNFVAILSIGFAIFNLIPIPPLDGSKIVIPFLPEKLRIKLYNSEQYLQFAFFILLFLGVLSVPLYFARQFVYNILYSIVFF